MKQGTRTIGYKGDYVSASLAHPAADALPWNLHDGDFAAMIEDMRVNGFDAARPILRDRNTGRLIGGRRREVGALLAGVEPIYRNVDWTEEEIFRYVQREDLQRRNLDPSQRAIAVAKLKELLPHGVRKGESCNVATLDEVAAEADVSKRTAADAAKVVRGAPELIGAVQEGLLPVNIAAKVADLSPDVRAKVANAEDVKAAAKAAVEGSSRTKQKASEKEVVGAGRGEASDDSVSDPVPTHDVEHTPFPDSPDEPVHASDADHAAADATLPSDQEQEPFSGQSGDTDQPQRDTSGADDAAALARSREAAFRTVESLIGHLRDVRSDLSELMSDERLAEAIRCVANRNYVRLETDGTPLPRGKCGGLPLVIRKYSSPQVDSLLEFASDLKSRLRRAEHKLATASSTERPSPWQPRHESADDTRDILI